MIICYVPRAVLGPGIQKGIKLSLVGEIDISNKQLFYTVVSVS